MELGIGSDLFDYKVTAILLAAGLSKRFDGDKLLYGYKGKTLLQRALELLLSLPVNERYIVTTEDRALMLQTQVPPEMLLINKKPEAGLSGSVYIGVEKAAGTHYLFLHADQPELTADDIIELIGYSRQNPAFIVYPVIDGKPCMPAIFPKSFRNALLKAEGDEGGRAVRDRHPDLCFEYKPENPGRFKDIDTQGDAEKFCSED